MLPKPLLTELATDVEKEAHVLAQFLKELNGYSEHELKLNPRANLNPVERSTAKRFILWVDRCLAEPKFQYRTFFRDALDLIDNARHSYENLIWTDRPYAGHLHQLVNCHLLISKNARALVKEDTTTYREFWRKCGDIHAMLMCAELLGAESPQIRNQIRVFGGYLVALIRQDHDLQESLKAYATGTICDAELLEIRKEFTDLLDHFYQYDLQKDPSYEAVMEMEYRPSEQLCNPATTLSQLCDVVDRLSYQAVQRKLPVVPRLAEELRASVVCPIED